MARERLRLEDMSDREVLLVLADLTDGADGWADSLGIAQRLGLKERRTAAVRLSWLQRWGAVEREYERDDAGNIRVHRDGRVRYTQRWRLTTTGRAIASGRLRKGLTTALESAGEEQMVVLTRYLATRSMGATARKLSEREWKRETLLRKGGS